MLGIYQGAAQVLEPGADLWFGTALRRPVTLPRLLALALALAAVSPTAAAGEGVRLVSREEPLAAPRAAAGSARVLPARAAPLRFDLVGLHWQGSGRVSFRTAGEADRWTPWRAARPEGEDLPDAGTREAAAGRGWKLGNPYWAGASRWIQYRLVGEVRRLRAHFVASPTRSARTLAIPRTPAIIRRSAWGANESIVRERPSYASSLRLAVVHHTAGASPSSPAESAAMLRGIQTYHVVSNGWNDIGYNFLVDRFGQIFEGRAGGVTRNVIGAHAQGFNTGSVGVAVLGTYESASISAAAKAALASLLAWRLDVAHADPLARLSWTSLGNPRFPAGTVVRLNAISGHRDTGWTSCPGDALYGELRALAGAVAGTGLPKLYEPRVAGSLGGPIRFTARLSEPRPWTVTVTDEAGTVVAQGSGTGTGIDWTWDASYAVAGAYVYAIEAGVDVRPARGSLGTPLALERLAVRPRAVTPNADGRGERAAITFSLAAPALVAASLVDLYGAPVTTISSERPLRAGDGRLVWRAGAAPDGRYRVVVTARTGQRAVSRSTAVVVDRTLGHLSVEPRLLAPRRRVRIAFELSRRAAVRVRIMRGGRPVVTLFRGALERGARTVSWRGRVSGRRVPRGAYVAVVEATTALGTRKLSGRFSVL